VLVVQTDASVVGLGLADGSEVWASPLRADDPLRVGPGQALIGTYDGIVAIDLADGGQRWTIGGSSDSVVVPSPAGALLALDDQDEGTDFAVVAPDGSVAQRLSYDDLPNDPYDLFVAGAGGVLVVVDPETGSAIDGAGARSLLSDEVSEIMGPGPDGLIWGLATTAGGDETPCLLDVRGEIVAVFEGDTEAEYDLSLPGVLVMLDAGQAILASVGD
jgi:hypothetical protein